jgi:hypothetical protein
MEQLAAFSEDTWQHVVCRICAHRFAILIEDGQSAAAMLCQTCSLMVDWFGQKEAPPTPQPVRRPSVEEVPRRAKPAPRQERQRVELAVLLDRWGELWRGSEDHSEEHEEQL